MDLTLITWVQLTLVNANRIKDGRRNQRRTTTSDGTKFFTKELCEHFENIIKNAPTLEDHQYRPSVGEECEFWSEDSWRECYIVGMGFGEEGYVIQSYEEVFFECDTIFRKTEGSDTEDVF